MNEMEKPPPYSPQVPPPTTCQPQPSMVGYQGAPGQFMPQAPMQNVPPGYQVVNPAAMPAYGSTIYIQQPPPVAPQVVLVGGCPACRVGVLEEDFTCFGVCMAIFFFPLGILCCLAMMQRRCPNCGAIFR